MFQDMFGKTRYKVGLHTHTNLSDGRVSPEECAGIYKEAGYDAIALTDHWKYGGEQQLGGLLILPGCEYNVGKSDTSVDVMHIVGVGMKNDPCIPADASRQQIIDSIKANGGIAILAHPAWSLNTPEEAMQLSGFAAVEIYNMVSDVGMSSRPYSGYFVDLLSNKGVFYPLVAADDTHYYNGSDETKCAVMVEAEECSVDSILNAVKEGKFYATQGPEVHVYRDGDTVVADCSPAVTIDFLTNSAWSAGKMTRGKDLTHAVYPIKEWDKWVRVEVKDENGKFAWSNIIKL